ncbi:MAG: GGDEF domain-containing protein [Thermodesulfovibrio sp.]|nr:GGDEF domain-containing protein [Thermodesulfovibrio sp.]
MNVLLCTNRVELSDLIKDYLKDEIELIQNHPINDELIDYVYKTNPDLILFDTFQMKKREWKYIENLTTAPSLRETPLILILSKKTEEKIKKICKFEIFDYLIEDIFKCELIMKIKMAKNLIEMKREFNSLLTKDPLTGAYNRRFLMERIQEELNWCCLYKEPLSLALFDIDFFKKINDTYGHLSGDRVLIEIVTLAKSFLSNRILLGRYGGEEFCILMPSTDKKEALETCEAFRKKVEESEFKTFSNRVINLSISIGLTTFYGNSLVTSSDLIKKADIALYRAKQSGRNRVIFQEFNNVE